MKFIPFWFLRIFSKRKKFLKNFQIKRKQRKEKNRNLKKHKMILDYHKYIIVLNYINIWGKTNIQIPKWTPKPIQRIV